MSEKLDYFNKIVQQHDSKQSCSKRMFVVFYTNSFDFSTEVPDTAIVRYIVATRYSSLHKTIQCCLFLTAACYPGHGENENGECVACGDGSFGTGESPCTSCGPNTNTGGNDNATESTQCGTL